MAIPSSHLSEFIATFTEPTTILSALRVHGFLDENAADAIVLQLILDCIAESEAEFNELGFTWASSDTRIAYQLSQGYLSPKGKKWLCSSSIAEVDGFVFSIK
jgi:hypothetical protein